MTTKQKFTVEDPNVVVLSNGRYAYKVKCPWEGKNGKEVQAFKFCSAAAYKRSCESKVEEPNVTEEVQTEPPEDASEDDWFFLSPTDERVKSNRSEPASLERRTQ